MKRRHLSSGWIDERKPHRPPRTAASACRAEAGCCWRPPGSPYFRLRKSASRFWWRNPPPSVQRRVGQVGAHLSLSAYRYSENDSYNHLMVLSVKLFICIKCRGKGQITSSRVKFAGAPEAKRHLTASSSGSWARRRRWVKQFWETLQEHFHFPIRSKSVLLCHISLTSRVRWKQTVSGTVRKPPLRCWDSCWCCRSLIWLPGPAVRGSPSWICAPDYCPSSSRSLWE